MGAQTLKQIADIGITGFMMFILLLTVAVFLYFFFKIFDTWTKKH